MSWTDTPGIAESCSIKYATAFACPGCSGCRDWKDVSARRWASSFAGSICASISAIGFGDGLGVGVGLGVAVGAIDAAGDAVAGAADVGAVGDEVKVTTRSGIAPHATKRIANRTARALILLG